MIRSNKTTSWEKIGTKFSNQKDIGTQAGDKMQKLLGFHYSKQQIKQVWAILLDSPSLFPMRALYLSLRLVNLIKWYLLNQPVFLPTKCLPIILIVSSLRSAVEQEGWIKVHASSLSLLHSFPLQQKRHTNLLEQIAGEDLVDFHLGFGKPEHSHLRVLMLGGIARDWTVCFFGAKPEKALLHIWE